MLKFYLHISADEQVDRLRAREKDPRTAWKLNPEDWREVPLWDEFTEAYEDVLARCSTREAPWYVVPADKKWFRNLAVMERIVLALRPYRKVWLDTLKEIGKSRMKEIRGLRAQVKRRASRSAPQARFATIVSSGSRTPALRAGAASSLAPVRVISMTLSCNDWPRVISIMPTPAAVSACSTAICVLLPPSPSSRK